MKNLMLIKCALFLLPALFMVAACQQDKATTKTIGPFPPEWSEGVVWYQIFPERFRNGDTTNDPKLEEQKGSWTAELIEPWQIHPWGSSWYELQDYEKENERDIWYNINRRRYGGDLQGVINKLDYLKELGVGAIYLNPVFVSPSHHKYDIAYYHHIHPSFGPDPEGDWEIICHENHADPDAWQWTSADSLMLKLIREVHQRDLKIILDGVFNHAGYNFFAFQDVMEKQQRSKYKDWFIIHSWDTDTSDFKYEGWWGVKVMPEFREEDRNLSEGPRNYIYAVTRKWMDPDGDSDPSDGIDGWRLDVADMVGHAFWEDWRKLVKSINPQAYLTGEITGSIQHIKPYLQGDEFDAAMNYNFSFITSEFFIHPEDFSVSDFDSSLRKLRNAFPFETNLAMQNLLGSHDTDRPLSRIVNDHLPTFLLQSNFFDETSARNPEYITTKPSEDDHRILRLMVLFQMTYPGAPMIYYGDEAGMWGAKDPGSRKPMLWPDIWYQPEVLNQDGSRSQEPDVVEPNTGLIKYYLKLTEIREENPALQKGSFEVFLVDDLRKLYGFVRVLDQDSLWVVLNNGWEPQEIDKDLLPEGKFRDLLDPSANAKTVLVVQSKSGRILRK
ncbi:MAG: glycoside hydrolase family 13 protein [Bacteroidales bacterium]|nr:glycoside hydrolase family 13 protein [Bacteroidales bacterium]MCF8350008.1 glycoside hydrolase family 13 protein [Bacteroidales bacterium]MCF8376363.1 glycoside hydrolase family 13 protein [Bacteroidales bacterium]MCF8400529.1 glycoside hydrolase family 13 protein [Bacteroidales bacterium]